MIMIIDYGMGNLRSVSKALEHLGGRVRITSKANDIRKADKLILPGVGSYGDAMRELRFQKLYDSITEYLKDSKPFLGICLGLQLLFAKSEESPDEQGFPFIPGEVKAFDSSVDKVPHMGWNQVRLRLPSHALLKNVPDNSHFYFVHSFYGKPDAEDVIAGSCDYAGTSFAAILAKGNAFATQFHPEKSQQAGLQILKNFVEL